MAKKPTASQLARKAKQKQKKLLQSVERRERKAVLKNNRREALAEKWHTTAAHEIGHAIVVALVGLPVKDVSCRGYGTFAGATTYATERKVNRTGFLGGLISWEDGVYGTSKSVCPGGT